MQQLLNGLYFIHNNKILHRDMKAANILITKNGVLKLADFGLARAYSLANPTANPINANRYTNRVVTLWYRPPELLLGERNYGPPIDMWGAGCIMAELWTRSPIMQGQSEQHQLNLISQLCGSITTEVWPECDKLELYNSLNLIKDQKRKVKERLKPYVRDNLALDLLDKLLWLDPSKRIDSDESLNHDFFWTDPMPADLAKTLSNHTISMFEFFAQPPGMAAARGLVKPGGHHGIAPHNLPHFPAGMPAGKGLISGSNRPHHYGLGPPPQQQTNTVNNQNINNYSKNFPHGSHGPPRRDYNKGGGAQHHQYHHQRYHPYGNNKGDASSLNNAASGSNAAQNSTQSTNLPQNQNNNSNHANN